MDYISFGEVFRQRSNPFHKPHAGCDSFHAYCNEQTAIAWRGVAWRGVAWRTLPNNWVVVSVVCLFWRADGTSGHILVTSTPTVCSDLPSYLHFRRSIVSFPSKNLIVFEMLHRHGLLMLKFLCLLRFDTLWFNPMAPE